MKVVILMNNTKEEKNDTLVSCTHDEITQFITQLNKTDYSRNSFTGSLDITRDVVRETECQITREKRN